MLMQLRDLCPLPLQANSTFPSAQSDSPSKPLDIQVRGSTRSKKGGGGRDDIVPWEPPNPASAQRRNEPSLANQSQVLPECSRMPSQHPFGDPDWHVMALLLFPYQHSSTAALTRGW
ncbi:hypothetical protein KIL84_012042 [Mauremys mutica]|uniref:Uncharacterized protein n=1 Tax=Mauremys mutica TaxID=74926 RepID=A0A9D3XFX3_9SAUR|nr:hypothetical protein KIL84_012042 [Mauremys mutica]